MILKLNRYALLLVLSTLTGCATYTTNYGVFSAQNSSGEVRDFKVSWRTADYPDWFWAEDETTDVLLETQCSERVWRLGDDGRCGSGIAACGIPGEDLQLSGIPVAGTGEACLAVTDSKGSQRISELEDQVQLTVSCYPAKTSIKRGKDDVVLDYLKASPVFYPVQTRKVGINDLGFDAGKLSERICKQK